MKARLHTFEHHRPALFALAYRMLGSKHDAEDILQDAYLKFQTVELETLISPRAYLITQVSRQCIDALRQAKYRTGYSGPWLPEPLVEDAVLEACPSELVHRYEQVSQGLLWMMENLSAEQRLVLILREVLDLSYQEIAEITDKSPDNCRQIYLRGQKKLGTNQINEGNHELANQYWIERLFAALSQLDVEALNELLHEDAVLISDGGGKVDAMPVPVESRQSILMFLSALQQHYKDDVLNIKLSQINNEAGLLIYVNGQLTTTCSIILQEGSIRYLLLVRNPDKLRAIPSKLSSRGQWKL